MGAGKDYIAEQKVQWLLDTGVPVVRLNFATEVKRMCYEYFSVEKNGSTIDGEYDEAKHGPAAVHRLIADYPEFSSVRTFLWRELLSKVGAYHRGDIEDARDVLQYFGTEIGRNNVAKDYWVQGLLNKVNTLPRDFAVVISDYRFPNEYLTPRMFNYPDEMMIECTKVTASEAVRAKRLGYKPGDHEHESESYLDDLVFDADIDNS